MAFVSQEDKKKLAPAIKAVLKKYNMKGTIAVRHNMTLIVNIKSGKIDFTGYFFHGDGYTQVNEYHIKNTYQGVHCNFLSELLAAMKGENYFCHDDSQTDYFHRSHYTNINIGEYHKPYQLAA